MSSSIKSKFDKYWGKIEDVNKLLIIALVLDPRYKLEYVKFCFGDMFDDKKTKELTCDTRELLIQLYECYIGVENILSSDQTSSSVSFDFKQLKEKKDFAIDESNKERMAIILRYVDLKRFVREPFFPSYEYLLMTQILQLLKKRYVISLLDTIYRLKIVRSRI
ncbi:hypothetical protein ACOSP7_018885 [Xanthoceras sorbifolium]